MSSDATCGISRRFHRFSPTQRQVAHVFLPNPPLSPEKYCYPPDPVRLACLIHATSVRSEPESNSQKKEFELLHTNIYCSVSLPKTRLTPVFKDQLSPSRANKDVVYQKTPLVDKGVFLENFKAISNGLKAARRKRNRPAPDASSEYDSQAN